MNLGRLPEMVTGRPGVLQSIGLRRVGHDLMTEQQKQWELGGKFKKEGAYEYLWLIYVDVWQKPTKYYKAIILQLKINTKRKKIGCFIIQGFRNENLKRRIAPRTLITTLLLSHGTPGPDPNPFWACFRRWEVRGLENGFLNTPKRGALEVLPAWLTESLFFKMLQLLKS